MNYLYEITRTAEQNFKIKTLKPYQILVMHKILEQEYENEEKRPGQIVILPTGTGKSLCFLIPATLCRGISIIVYPLLALMNDQTAKLRKAGISCVCLRGGQTRKERKALFKKLEDGCKIVVTNPETLTTKSVKNELKKYRVSLFV
ncbi:MAG: DEAD/DEAH box helicase, partial [Sphaerochaetaceae bacterium]|nr:DEAD/DEAH box helicase [Sphaerochaetaceae bacterium]